MPFGKEGRYRPMTRGEEIRSNLIEGWVGLVQAGEYDRIAKYVLQRSRAGQKSIVGDVLTGAKQLAMNVRRTSAVAGGVVVGLAATGTLPELLTAVSPTVAIVSVAALGLNFGIDQMMENELKNG